MHRKDIEAYFTRKQREVLIVQRLSPWEYRIITPKADNIDQSPGMGAWILKMRGWDTASIARAFKESWYIADKLIQEGQEKVEEEIGIKIKQGGK